MLALTRVTKESAKISEATIRVSAATRMAVRRGLLRRLRMARDERVNRSDMSFSQRWNKKTFSPAHAEEKVYVYTINKA